MEHLAVVVQNCTDGAQLAPFRDSHRSKCLVEVFHLRPPSFCAHKCTALPGFTEKFNDLVNVSVHDDGHTVFDIGCCDLWHKVKLGWIQPIAESASGEET